MKKQILLTALTLALLASAVMTAAAEEAVGTILFEPNKSNGYYYGRGYIYEYILDTQDNLVEDMYMRVYSNDKYNTPSPVRETLSRYLKEGRQIAFENEGLKPFDTFNSERLLAIIIDGRRIELTQIFSRQIIADEFPYLDKKLRAQGR
jgi:hypothetical protein